MEVISSEALGVLILTLFLIGGPTLVLLLWLFRFCGGALFLCFCLACKHQFLCSYFVALFWMLWQRQCWVLSLGLSSVLALWTSAIIWWVVLNGFSGVWSRSSPIPSLSSTWVFPLLASSCWSFLRSPRARYTWSTVCSYLVRFFLFLLSEFFARFWLSVRFSVLVQFLQKNNEQQRVSIKIIVATNKIPATISSISSGPILNGVEYPLVPRVSLRWIRFKIRFSNELNSLIFWIKIVWSPQLSWGSTV